MNMRFGRLANKSRCKIKDPNGFSVRFDSNSSQAGRQLVADTLCRIERMSCTEMQREGEVWTFMNERCPKTMNVRGTAQTNVQTTAAQRKNGEGEEEGEKERVEGRLKVNDDGVKGHPCSAKCEGGTTV